MNDIYRFQKNGKDVYVGKDKEGYPKRVNDHLEGKGGAPYLRHAIQKYGPDAFTHDVIESNVPPELLSEREKYWIHELGTLSPNGYNISPGGDGGDICSQLTPEQQESRNAKISDTLTGKPKPPRTAEHNAKISAALIGRSAWNKGVPCSAEHRDNVSEGLTQWHADNPDAQTGLNNPHWKAYVKRHGSIYGPLFNKN